MFNRADDGFDFEDNLSLCNGSLSSGGVSLDLNSLNGPSLETILNSTINNSEILSTQLEKLSSSNPNETSNAEKAAWALSATILGAGIEKLITLGYISADAAITGGASIGAALLVYNLYKKLSKEK